MKFRRWLENSEPNLTWLLDHGPTSYRGVGPEKIQSDFLNHGINVYKDPYGSYRFVMYHDGKPVAGLQIVKGKTGIIASNVYTHPEFRRKGLATALFKQAQSMFPRIKISDSRSDTGGKDWAASLGH